MRSGVRVQASGQVVVKVIVTDDHDRYKRAKREMNLFKMLDERTKHPVYQENMQAANTRVGLNIFVRILFPTCCVILSCASAL